MIAVQRSLVFAGALGLGLGLFLADGVSSAGAKEGGSGGAARVPTSAPERAPEIKLGFVDLDEMFRRHGPFLEEVRKMREEARTNERKLRDKSREISELEGRMFLAPRHGYLQRKYRADEERLRGELDFIKNWNATEAEQKQIRLRARYYEKFSEAVSRYGERHGYTAILKRSSPPRTRGVASLTDLEAGIDAHTTLFVDQRAADITAAVLATLPK